MHRVFTPLRLAIDHIVLLSANHALVLAGEHLCLLVLQSQHIAPGLGILGLKCITVKDTDSVHPQLLIVVQYLISQN
jgi:hypothetical protein